jgi:hypothetical protein
MKFTLLIALAILFSCMKRELRGYVSKSSNGETYLIIKDDCNQQVFIDGIKWDHKINEKGLVSPGVHEISGCGSVIIEIKKGTIYKFDYWGP